MRTVLSDEVVADAWMAADRKGMTVAELAAELDVPKQALYYRAKKLRSRGVPLPPLPKHNQRYYDLLAKKVKQHNGERQS